MGVQWEFNGSSMKFNGVQWNSDALGNESSMGVQSLAKAGTRGSSMSLGCNACGLSLLIARGAMYLHSAGTQWAMGIQWEFNPLQKQGHVGVQWSSISGFPFQNTPYPIYDFRPPVSRFRSPVSEINFSDHYLSPWFLLYYKIRHHQSKFLILHAVCISNNVLDCLAH